MCPGGRQGVCSRPDGRAHQDPAEAAGRAAPGAAPQQHQQAQHAHHQRAGVQGHRQRPRGRHRDRRREQRQGGGGKER